MRLEELESVLGTGGKRYAGGLLGAALTPTLMSLIDDQEESKVSQFIGSPALVLAGAYAGGYLGGNINLAPNAEAKAAALRDLVNALKTEAKQKMGTEGPQAANDFFGREKAKRTDAYNDAYDQQHKNLPGKDYSPAQRKQALLGALIGAGVTLPAAYSQLRDGEVQ